MVSMGTRNRTRERDGVSREQLHDLCVQSLSPSYRLTMGRSPSLSESQPSGGGTPSHPCSRYPHPHPSSLSHIRRFSGCSAFPPFRPPQTATNCSSFFVTKRRCVSSPFLLSTFLSLLSRLPHPVARIEIHTKLFGSTKPGIPRNLLFRH